MPKLIIAEGGGYGCTSFVESGAVNDTLFFLLNLGCLQ